jgi:hypothetical protein
MPDTYEGVRRFIAAALAGQAWLHSFDRRRRRGTLDRHEAMATAVTARRIGQ